jgi:hypothetical protein
MVNAVTAMAQPTSSPGGADELPRELFRDSRMRPEKIFQKQEVHSGMQQQVGARRSDTGENKSFVHHCSFVMK